MIEGGEQRESDKGTEVKKKQASRDRVGESEGDGHGERKR